MKKRTKDYVMENCQLDGEGRLAYCSRLTEIAKGDGNKFHHISFYRTIHSMEGVMPRHEVQNKGGYTPESAQVISLRNRLRRCEYPELMDGYRRLYNHAVSRSL